MGDWQPGKEHFHNPPPMEEGFFQDKELAFSLEDAERRPGLVRRRLGDVATIQLKARPRVVRDVNDSFTQSEQRGTIKMEDIAHG